MGNHEYCEDCGSSSFHHGRTCQEYNPEGYAEVEAWKKLRAERQALGEVLVKDLAARLLDQRIPAKAEIYYGSWRITICGYDLVDGRVTPWL